MAADLHIHIVTDDMTEEDFKDFFSHCLGSKYYDPHHQEPPYGSPEYLRNHHLLLNSPNIWVGEVSWLKAALVGDGKDYVPHVVEEVAALINEDKPVIDDEFLKKMDNALRAGNQTRYSVANRKDVMKFLKQYKGKRVFMISW